MPRSSIITLAPLAFFAGTLLVCWVVLSCAGRFQVPARLFFSPRVASQHPYLGDNRAVPWLTQVMRVARPQTAQHQVRAGDP